MKRQRQADDAPPSPPAVCRCGLDVLPLPEIAARLGVAESGVLRLHRRAGLPLIRLTSHRGSVVASWRAVEAWARARADAR